MKSRLSLYYCSLFLGFLPFDVRLACWWNWYLHSLPSVLFLFRLISFSCIFHRKQVPIIIIPTPKMIKSKINLFGNKWRIFNGLMLNTEFISLGREDFWYMPNKSEIRKTSLLTLNYLFITCLSFKCFTCFFQLLHTACNTCDVTAACYFHTVKITHLIFSLCENYNLWRYQFYQMDKTFISLLRM